MGIVHSKTKISEERKDYLRKKFQYAVGEFRRIATRSNHLVPKEEQLSIDLGNKKVFGIIDRTLKWIENKFKYFFPRYNLFPEVGTEERKIPGTDSKVKYFTPDEQVQHTKIIYQKKLYDDLVPNIEGELLKDFKGNPYDTTNAISKGQKGYVAYVITLDGKLITHEHINIGKGEYAYRHSTLAGGKPILCSGLMQVIDGKITYIDNNSGHYKPTSANLYNAVKKLKGVFSEDAKVHCLTNWSILRQDLPFLCRLPDKKYSVEQFLKKMEKIGRDGLTEYERHFARIKKDNEEYRQKLHFVNYKSPTSEPPNKPTIHKKHKLKFSSYINSYLKFLKEFDEDPEVRKITIEHSIRKVIGANYGHKPKIDIEFDNESKAPIGVNITFCCEEDSNRFIRLLDYKKCSYTQTSKHVVFISSEQAENFIKDTLQMKIDSIESLGSMTTRVLA